MVVDPRTAISRRDLEGFRDHALALADEARRQLRAFWNGVIEVKRKPDGSYVTDADLQIERKLRALVERAFPEHGIVGEEFGVHRPQAEFQWIFDPVDGTEDFVQRIPTFGTIIALYYRGQPIVGVLDIPILETRVHAGYGLGAFRNDERLRLADLDPATSAGAVRIMLSARANFVRHRDDGALFDAVTRSYPNHRIYRSCYAHVCAVTGQADATIDFGNPIWDIAAARILIEEAGGAYRLVQDYETPQGRIYSSVFGRPSVVEKLSALLR
jgi:histidinol-phosphatase